MRDIAKNPIYFSGAPVVPYWGRNGRCLISCSFSIFATCMIQERSSTYLKVVFIVQWFFLRCMVNLFQTFQSQFAFLSRSRPFSRLYPNSPRSHFNNSMFQHKSAFELIIESYAAKATVDSFCLHGSLEQYVSDDSFLTIISLYTARGI